MPIYALLNIDNTDNPDLSEYQSQGESCQATCWRQLPPGPLAEISTIRSSRKEAVAPSHEIKTKNVYDSLRHLPLQRLEINIFLART